MEKVKLNCDWCGKEFLRYQSQQKGKRHHFCSRRCLSEFSSKQNNPDGYRLLKDYTRISEHMTKLNIELNPSRMNLHTKEKIRNARIGTGKCKSYSKLYGKHEHRVVAENTLGRKLRKGEVVHHLDFNPRNNSPDNLMIFPSQSEHARYHAALDAFFRSGNAEGGDAQ